MINDTINMTSEVTQMRKPVEVRRGDLRATGATKSEANAKLEKQIDWALDTGGASIVETRFGLILVLAGTPSGFWWQVIDPSNLVHGKQIYGTCFVGQIAYSDALDQMRAAAFQRAWTVFFRDDEALELAQVLPRTRADLQSWCKWQREQIKAA
jgi:hypothetical protein